MDVLLLSRIQFALTAGFHYIYVPLTIGLSVLIFLMELRRHQTKRVVYDQMSRFWTKLLAINFVIGVATGITMEFQFGTNWANYSRFVGDIFGAPLAAEGIFAFFLESAFIALMIFGKERISSFMRVFSSLMVAIGTNLSAFWILAANSWQQTPAGYQLVDGRAQLTDFAAALFNYSTMPRFLHAVVGAYILSGVFLAAVSAYYVLKNKNLAIAKPSLRWGLIFGVVFSVLQIFVGHWHAKEVAVYQPAKLAAFELQWETQTHAPLLLFALPDKEAQSNRIEIAVPGMLSYLAFGSTEASVTGLRDIPEDEWAPLAASSWSFHLMVGFGCITAVVLLIGLIQQWRGKIELSRRVLKACIVIVPLVYLANELGWMAAEVGRQPWIVQNLLRTTDAVSAVSFAHVAIVLTLFCVYYLILFILFLYFMMKSIRNFNLAEASANSGGKGKSRRGK
ncbi:MAG: cytochrome ubiquinol oxidase subunit I [Peptococcaceae bacterium]|jgi:cytochrome d ubiquinol oxidase subunit I|nr:cytochrome ubiquinol oxidase subunit I [Peptococcaceae bacterium]